MSAVFITINMDKGWMRGDRCTCKDTVTVTIVVVFLWSMGIRAMLHVHMLVIK